MISANTLLVVRENAREVGAQNLVEALCAPFDVSVFDGEVSSEKFQQTKVRRGAGA